MDEIFEALQECVDTGKTAALVTIIGREGSAPRAVGAKMAVTSDLRIIGSVSGGCVESDVVLQSQKVFKTGKPLVVDYGISDDLAWSVGLACGGKIKVLIQPVTPEEGSGLNCEILRLIKDMEKGRRLVCLATILTGNSMGEVCLISEGRVIYPEKPPDWMTESHLIAVNQHEKKADSGIYQLQKNDYFIDWIQPQPRIVVIGGVHIAIPLMEMAQTLGYYTIVIDPRKLFANRDRFPLVDELVTKWPTEGLHEIAFREDDYLVLLSHDDKLDLPALAAALNIQCNYVGMLSSRITRDRRFEQMATDGFSAEELSKVHSPIGVNIGASSPEEIALSILAEITVCRRGKNNI